MQIQISGAGWIGSVLCSDVSNPDGLWHVFASTDGDSKESAFAGATFILELFAKGRQAFIRVPPEADSYTDFDTKITKHHGFVRFSFRQDAGDWQLAEAVQPVNLKELSHG